MARGELLRKLFLSHKRGSDEDFHAIALEIIAEEQQKKNNQLAKDLLRVLENGGKNSLFPKSSRNIGSLPKDKDSQTLLVDVRHPDRIRSDILLSKANEALLDRIMEEYQKAEILRTHGLVPKTKILFCGPPGCGKTLCAEVLSHELGLPLLYTRFDAIVSSYLGETAANLRKVFDYASSGRWVVFFDEFDAIGKSRDNPDEHGEIKRVINSFLQLLDGFSETSIVIAATNHEHLLDPALWRRFDEIVVFPKPSVHEIRKLLGMKLKNFPHRGVDIKSQASKLKGMSHADIERLCFDSIKTCILENDNEISTPIFESAIKQQKMRITAAESARRTARQRKE
jgi:SpoVK/Ycf46/Vps4 family AAA+-type ATPase